MPNAIPFLKILSSKDKPGEVVYAKFHLSSLGFIGYADMKGFLSDLQDEGYINFTETDSGYVSDIAVGHKDTLKTDFDFDVKLRFKGERLLIEEGRINATIKTSKTAVRAAWFSGLVATLSIVLTVVQAISDTPPKPEEAVNMNANGVKRDSISHYKHSETQNLFLNIDTLEKSKDEKRSLDKSSSRK